jgi:subtilisin family serine protease
MYAPGLAIRSADSTANCPRRDGACYAVLSGTSQAAPHVAGAAALAWAELGIGTPAGDVRRRLLAAATAGALRQAPKAGVLEGPEGGAGALLLYSGAI